MQNADRISELYRGEVGRLDAQARVRKRVDWLVGQARGRVLDIGCSQGIVSILCAREGHQVLGIDLEEDRIVAALKDRERKPPEVRERLQFRVADATALDLADRSFDAVLLGGVLQQLADPALILREASRVVSADGIVAITTPLGYVPHPDRRQTFFVASLVEAVAPHLAIDSLAVQDEYLCLLATPGVTDPAHAATLIIDAQRELEQALATSQRSDLQAGRRLRSLARGLRQDLRRAKRRDREARRRVRRLKRKLAARQRTRWTRLGKALARARKPRQALGLPVAISRALRKLPPAPAPSPVRSSGAAAKPPVPPVPAPLFATAEAITDADRELRIELPEAAPLPPGPIARPDLRVATILDRFSAVAFRYEWQQLDVGPDDWRERFEAERPDMLFVESAWKGNDDRWTGALAGRGSGARHLDDLVGWCRREAIPTVFWNKEDPPHFSTFLEAARLFDHVLTTDSNRLGPYREALGREDVSVLSFGAQPRIHNPIAVPGGRRPQVAFAGTFFQTKHPGRRAQTEVILGPARDFDLHIFTRFAPGERAQFDWPAEYLAHVVGSLPYERMITAYKAYRLFLNVNTVVDSPTMCARRAFEISATGTPVLSGDSLALREVFGERIAIATEPQETRDQLERLLGDPELAARRGHVAMRHVLREHTYGDRVDQILRIAGLEQHLRPARASISVVLCLDADEPPERLLEQLAAQSRTPSELVLAPTRPGVDPDPTANAARRAGLRQVSTTGPENELTEALDAAAALATGELLAIPDPRCGYGEHFLADLAAAFTYTGAEVIGKAAGGPGDTAAEHSYGAALHPSSLLARAAVVREVGFGGREASPQRNFLAGCEASGRRLYCADRFSFEPAGVLSRD